MEKVKLPGGALDGSGRGAVKVVVSGGTIAGPSRDENQDALLIDGVITQHWDKRVSAERMAQLPFALAVVDGMGGYAGGREAAGLLASAFADVDFSAKGEDFGAWMQKVSARIAAAGGAWGTPDMGAAFSLVVVTDKGMHLANVGDCRIYQLIGGYCTMLSEDDRASLDSSGLTQAIGGLVQLDCHEYAVPHGADSRLVLCSDGVWGLLGDDCVQELCAVGSKPGEAVERVLGECLQKKAGDNCTIVVADVLVSTAE